MASTEIVPFEPERMPQVRRFVEQVFQRPRSEAYYRWRYLEPGLQHGLLALRDGECIAMNWGFRRSWRVGEAIVPALEMWDWFCLPRYRNSGLGIRLMQRMMEREEILVVAAGSDDSRTLLPRLRWRTLPGLETHVLPLGPSLAPDLRRRFGVPEPLGRLALRTAALALRAPRRRPPRGGRAVIAAVAGPEVEALYRGPSDYGTYPTWTREQLAWLTSGFAGAGHFLPLYFALEERLVGFVLVRVHGEGGLRTARIVELFAPRPEPSLLKWMVSEATRCAAGLGAGGLAANTTCPAVGRALRRNRFFRLGTSPVHVWAPGELRLPEPLLVGGNTADAPLLPYPASWWDAEG
jgi:hypothetical protein